MSIDILALANQVAETGPNLNETTAGGGGDYAPPPVGTARARFIGYVETGNHEVSVGAGKPRMVKPQVELIFELSGPKYEPEVGADGQKQPIRVTFRSNAAANYGQLNEKAGLYKAFVRMNWDGQAKHFSQLLGKAFLLDIAHDPAKEPGKAPFVRLKDDSGVLAIKPPRFTNPIDGTITEVPVDPPVSPIRFFTWNAAPDIIGKLWDTLFIDGEYPERKDKDGKVTAPAKSKNVFQEKIKAAANFVGSPIHNYLQTKGVALNLGAQAEAGKAEAATAAASTKSAPAASPSDDPLANF